MIEVREVTKTYGKKKNSFTALDNISFTIPDNTTVAILGKSGSGKSTLMHVLAGLDRPQTGQVIIDGQDILQLRPREIDRFRAEKMSFIFQSFFVEGGESCYENVSLSLEMAHTPHKERRTRIEAALNSVDLGDKIRQKAKNLSGGQKQRLAIARAIVDQPAVLFADEPTGNLDSTTAKIIEKLLFSYQKAHKATLVIVTHDEDLAAQCEHIMRIKDGAIQTIEENQTVSKGGAV